MFDQDDGLNISTINTTNLDVRAVSAYDETEFELNWTVIEFRNKKLKIQLEFEKPLLVSVNMDEIN